MCAPIALRVDLVDCLGATELADGCTCKEGVGEAVGGGGVDGTMLSIVVKITR